MVATIAAPRLSRNGLGVNSAALISGPSSPIRAKPEIVRAGAIGAGLVSGPEGILRGKLPAAGTGIARHLSDNGGVFRVPALAEGCKWRVNPRHTDELLALEAKRQIENEEKRAEEATRHMDSLDAKFNEAKAAAEKKRDKPPEAPPKKRASAIALQLDNDSGRLPAQSPGDQEQERKAYTWIRFDNSEPAREARRNNARLTQQAVMKKGYQHPKVGHVKLEHVDTMLRTSKRIASSLGNLTLPSGGARFSSTEVTPFSGFVLDAVSEFRGKHGDNIAAVSAASAYHCGGGFITGGRHALEEAICVQTSVYESLISVRRKVLPDSPDHETGKMYIPADGCIVSPKVEMFRSGSGEGYPFMESTVLLGAMVSVAMFNRNEKLRDAPVDAPMLDSQYEEQVRAKFRAVLAGALEASCDAIIMPDAGCGVYKNDPKVVGRIFGEVVRQEFWGRLKEVILVGSQEFKDAAVEASKDRGAGVSLFDKSDARPSGRTSVSNKAFQVEDPRSRSRKVGVLAFASGQEDDPVDAHFGLNFLSPWCDCGEGSITIESPDGNNSNDFRTSGAAYAALRYWPYAAYFANARSEEEVEQLSSQMGPGDDGFAGYGAWDALEVVTRAKFPQGSLRWGKLVATGDAILMYDGQDKSLGIGGDGKGENRLGTQLMLCREAEKDDATWTAFFADMESGTNMEGWRKWQTANEECSRAFDQQMGRGRRTSQRISQRGPLVSPAPSASRNSPSPPAFQAQASARAEAEERARQEAQEAQASARAEAEARARQEAQASARAEAEARARQEAAAGIIAACGACQRQFGVPGLGVLVACPFCGAHNQL